MTAQREGAKRGPIALINVNLGAELVKGGLGLGRLVTPVMDRASRPKLACNTGQLQKI